MKRIINWLMPKEKEFFDLLAEQSDNVLDAAKQLKSFIDEYHNFERKERKSKAQAIKGIERRGDEITQKIIGKLRVSAAAIDKGDIRKISALLEDIVNLINKAALGFIILGIERIDGHINKFAGIAVNSLEEINKNIAELRKLKHVKEHYIKVRDLEAEADNLYHEALSELFHFYKNPVDIIKYKEIYGILEEIIDKCKEVANLVEDVIEKHV